MDWLLEKIFRYPRQSLVVGVTVAVLVGVFAWWQFIWQNPRRVFEDMLANSLTTLSVAKEAHAGSGQQSVQQFARLEMGSTNASRWLVMAKQSGTIVSTESIGLPTSGYIRYLAIGTAQTTSSHTPYDFSSVLNVWGKTDGKTDTALNGLLSQTLLDVSNAPAPPIGNLPETQRNTILAYMASQQIFVPDYAHVKRETIAGRAVYTYQVAVKLGAYIRMMQAFAHDLGLTGLDTLDPSQYSTLPPLSVMFSVDRVSHELARVSYPSSGFTQTYMDWGLMTPITLPRTAITTTELQQRLQALGA